MLKKLRVQFVVINMTIVTVMLIAICGTILHFTQKSLAEDVQSTLRTTALNMNPIHHHFPLHSPSHTLPFPVFTVQVHSDGEYEISGEEYHGRLSDKAYAAELIQAALDAKESTGVLRKYNLHYYRMRPTIDTVSLAFASASHQQHILTDLVRNCLLIGGAGFLLFLFLSILLARRTVRPVEETWAQQKQFVADASHELKTPLTVITTSAELLQAEVCSDEDRQQFSEHILTMSHRMRSLIAEMLDLARADQGADTLTLTQFSFSKLVSDALLPFEPVFFERGLTLTSQVEEGILLQGDPVLLRQAVDILLDNAQKYASASGDVSLCLQRHKRGACLLSVSNCGTPISPADQKAIFTRFYRTDRARTGSGSYGLGLSIAQRVVENHRGKIWCSSANGRNTFYIQLPV